MRRDERFGPLWNEAGSRAISEKRENHTYGNDREHVMWNAVPFSLPWPDLSPNTVMVLIVVVVVAVLVLVLLLASVPAGAGAGAAVADRGDDAVAGARGSVNGSLTAAVAE